MLRIMSEEQALIAETNDERTAKRLRSAHRLSARRYEMWVNVSPHVRTRRVIARIVFALVYFGVAFALMSMIDSAEAESDRPTQVIVFQALSLTFMAAAVVLVLVPFVQAANERASRREHVLRRIERYQRRLTRRRGSLTSQRESLVRQHAPESEIAALDEKIEHLNHQWMGAQRSFDRHLEDGAPLLLRGHAMWLRRRARKKRKRTLRKMAAQRPPSSE